MLSRLHALDITDKHRLVLVIGAAHKHVVMRGRLTVPWQTTPVEFPPLAINPADRQFPLRDNAEVFRVSAAARNPDAMDEHQVVFDLAFGDDAEVSGLPLIQTLESLHRHVAKIVTISDKWFF
ncbi:MAG: hypothetical protein IID34_09545 [Planctomycetes bacterium]|nr:hypothetical protein [Planctomycetota bacterium]